MNSIYKSIRQYFIFLFLLFVTYCSSGKLLKKSDYNYSKSYLSQNELHKAILYFPKKERNSFITTMEKTYLHLIQGKPEINELLEYSKKIEQRVRYSASRELKTFFYLETPEGYYASEHEVILMHIFLSWGYSLKKEYEKGYVEAKKSANLLNNHWSSAGRFDDPSLRILLAGVWAMCGHWEEAQIDFRIAYNMNKELKWALSLAELETPPKELYIILAGPGPEPLWDPKFKMNPMRGMRSLRFVHSFSDKNINLKLISEGEVIPLNTAGDTRYWYERHFTRDNEIQDLIKDSNYGQVVLAKAIQGTAVSTLGIVGGLTVGALGIGIGGGLIYLSLEANMGELAVLGATVIYAGIVAGYELAGTSVKYSISETEKAMDNSEDYRFVRFLPDRVYTGWSMEEYTNNLYLTNNQKKVKDVAKLKKVSNQPINVKFVYYSGK